MVPLAAVQCFILTFLTSKIMKPVEILTTYRTQFSHIMLSRTQVYDWSKSLKNASQRLQTCHMWDDWEHLWIKRNVEQINGLIWDNCRVRVRELAKIVGISAVSVETIIHNSRLVKLSKSWVPKLLSYKQKEKWFKFQLNSWTIYKGTHSCIQ
jgi:hypothetical protein